MPPAGEIGSTRNRFSIILACCLVLLIVLPFPFDRFKLTWPLAAAWNWPWKLLLPWIAEHVLQLGVDVRNHPWRSGETTWEYVRVGTATALALVIAPCWAWLDRGRTDLDRLDRWLRIYLRVYLAYIFFGYGWAKVIPSQFPPLGPDRLSETIGEASPSGLLWAFMGYAVPYTVFGGLCELAAGALLCFRRTTRLGALAGIGLMLNLVALNFSYDIGVKLGSTFFLLALTYLAAPDIRRLADMLLFNRATAPVPEPPSGSVWSNRLGVVLPGVLAGYFFLWGARASWTSAHAAEWGGRFAARPALYGLYDVESVLRRGVAYALGPADSTNWSRVAIGQPRSTIRLASGSLGFYTASVDTVARTLRLGSMVDSSIVVTLGYERPDSAHLVLRGRLGPDSVEMRLTRRDESTYRLLSHPFHWTHDRVENW